MVVGTNERPNHGPWPTALHCPALHLSEHTPANTPNTPQYSPKYSAILNPILLNTHPFTSLGLSKDILGRGYAPTYENSFAGMTCIDTVKVSYRATFMTLWAE